MKFLPITVLAAFCPVSALAAETGGEAGGFNIVSSFIQMAASLAVVVGIILVFHYLSRKWLKGSIPGSSRAGYIRVVENRFLAPKKALLLVEVSGEYMLLGSCGDNITFLKQVDVLEDVEVIGDVSQVPFSEALQEKLKGFAARFPSASGALAYTLKKGGARS